MGRKKGYKMSDEQKKKISKANLGKKNSLKHGLSYKRVYSTYQGMLRRIEKKRKSSYKYYVLKGIKICSRWKGDNGLENFYKDMGDRPKNKHSLDRIDNSGDYEPKNCRWATIEEQNRNKDNNVKYKGECAAEACRRLGGCRTLIRDRLNSGWSVERAFTEKSRFSK